MSFVVKLEKKNYLPCPEGMHAATCVDVVDLGQETSQFGTAHKCRIVWEVDAENPETGSNFTVRSKYTVSLHEKANLRRTLETWRGRKFTDEELSGFDLEKLVGAPCQIMVNHDVGEDGTIWANVKAVVPTAKGTPPFKASGNYTRVKDRDDYRPNPAAKKPDAPLSDADAVPF